MVSKRRAEMNQIADRSGPWPSSVQDRRAQRRACSPGHGVDYDQFERHSGVGGLWDIDNPGTPCTSHALHRPGSPGFYDYPMPASFSTPPDPQTDPLLPPTGSSPTTSASSTRSASGKRCPRRYRRRQVVGDHLRRHHRTLSRVVCASGTNWHPRIPVHPGHFDGEIRHAVTYRSAREFDGKARARRRPGQLRRRHRLRRSAVGRRRIHLHPTRLPRHSQAPVRSPGRSARRRSGGTAPLDRAPTDDGIAATARR